MTNKKMGRYRIYYLAGAADIASDYKTWAEKSSLATSFGGGVFMEQFFQLCHELDADAHLVSTADGTSKSIGQFFLDYRKPGARNLTGFSYHAKLLVYMAQIIISIIRFRPNLLLIGIAERYWFLLYILYFSNIEIVPFFHCTLWPRMNTFEQLTFAQRLLYRLTGSFLKHRCSAVLSISDVINLQLRKITGGEGPRVVPFRPIYERALFENIAQPQWHKRPLRILFVGRIANDKGIYDLVETAKLLRERGNRDIVFDICGTGEELQSLTNIVRRDQLTNIHVHGQCDRAKLHSLYSQCHGVIVPTSRSFPEGFNRVSIEGVLAGRPVIISSAAIEPMISSAAIEVQPGDTGAYAEAIIKLRDDKALYGRLSSAAISLQNSFYDIRYGWENGLRSIIGDHPNRVLK